MMMMRVVHAIYGPGTEVEDQEVMDHMLTVKFDRDLSDRVPGLKNVMADPRVLTVGRSALR